MQRAPWSLAVLLWFSIGCPPAPGAPTTPGAGSDGEAGPPVAKVEKVTDTYHGTDVADPYRWLENWDDAAVKDWSAAQNRYARSVLDALPAAASLRPKIKALLEAPAITYYNVERSGGRLFAMKRQPPKQQPMLVTFESADDPSAAKVLIDPAVLDAKGTTSIDWFIPSPDGKLVAVSLSVGGSESGDVHIYDVATAKPVHEVITRVNGGTAGGDLAWTPDGKGYYYTRYPRKGERPPVDMKFYQQLYFHQLGQTEVQDRYELGKGFPRVAEIQLDVDQATGRVLATVQKGDGGEFAHYLRSKTGEWTQFSDFGDRIVHASFGAKNRLYVVSRAGAPRGKLLQTSAERPDPSKAKVLIEQGQDTLVTNFWGGGSVIATKDRLYLLYQLGGPSDIRTFDLKGRPAKGPRPPPVSAVRSLIPLEGNDLLFDTVSYVQPATWHRWDAKAKTTTQTPMSTKSPADFSNVEVRRELATSKDGTQVPVNILVPKGAPTDGSNPCVARGYGGYGVSLVPRFRAGWSVLLEHGFVLAVANLRGGSEFGDEWHEQGRLTVKQNVFDDFAAVLHHLIDRGYTKSERLAIEGGSNGGLLMGATMVQNPTLMKAVVSHVGIYDMLRVELSPNGAFNVTEFGTVKDPGHFKALYAYSPYHNVQDGTAYPPTLFMTGENDPRVDPMQSRKMTARLQAAQGGDAPILLRTSSDTGHGGGTALGERIEQTVDAYAFLFEQLGIGPAEPP